MNTGDKTVLDSEAIRKILPHEPPFVLLDRVIEANAEQVVAIKQTRSDDWYFKGHFPGYPVMPGTLIVEAMAQASLILYSYNFSIDNLFYLVKEKTRFLAPVLPGDCLRIVATKVKFLKHMGIGAAEAFVEGKKVAESELGFMEKK